MKNTILNSELTINDIPAPNSDWKTIVLFAQSFDGYKTAGSFENAGRIANERRGDTLTDLRICLFFEQRRFNHFGYPPEGEALYYIQSLLERIRIKILEGQKE